MSITTYVTGWLTKKTLSTALWIAIPVFLLYQCNRGCGSEPQPVSSTFDYTAIAVSLNKVDTIPVDTTLAAEDLRKITIEEMINFTKHYDELFVNYIRKKYQVSNGYVERIDSTE